MACIVCFNILVVIRFLKLDRYSREVIKPFNCVLSCDGGYFHWLIKIIYMATLMAEDKLRYNDMNTTLYETDTSKP